MDAPEAAGPRPVPVRAGMGMFSYDCKECGHPLLAPNATDAGINEWMSEAVVLTPRGGRIVGTYDGYGGVDSLHEIGRGGLDNSACLHEACWEAAGRPEWSRYGEVSQHSKDQGWFFDDGAHDMIDPRIKEGREELLRAGVEARTRRRYDERARRVHEWVRDPEGDGPAWRQRFRYGRVHEAGKPVDGKWYIADNLGAVGETDFMGTEEEVASECARLWDEFIAGEECAAMLARAEEIQAEAMAKFVEELKVKGRYHVQYGVSHVPGDVVDGMKMARQRFYVDDRLTCSEAASFDYEGEPRDFGPPDMAYDGNHSREWEARVGENRADSQRRSALAVAEAERLNAEWAATGWPVPPPSETDGA